MVIIWLALRSARIILGVFFSLIVGLVITAAAGLMMVGAFNLISVAFAVLLIGLGADFGIQFSVRYRSERHDLDDLPTALRSAAAKAGGPLALVAASTAVGFFCFLPTVYRGVSELGQIAGAGMIIAFVATVTLFPALLSIFNPPREPYRMGFSALASADRFLARHRIAVVHAPAVLAAEVRADLTAFQRRLGRHLAIALRIRVVVVGAEQEGVGGFPGEAERPHRQDRRGRMGHGIR